MEFGIRVGLAVVVLAAAVAACRSATVPPRTEEGHEDWGAEALEFFEAHAEAICSQDVYDVVAFYDPAAVADYRALTLGRFPGQLREGRQQAISFLDLCVFTPTSEIEVAVDEVFLHPLGAVTIERWTDHGGGQDATVAVLFTMGPEGIELVRYVPTIDQVLSNGGPDSAQGLITPVATLVEQHWSDQAWAEIEVYGFRVDAGATNDRDRIDVDVDHGDELEEVVLIADVGPSSCPVATALWWVIAEGQIVEQRRHVGVTSRACLDPEDLLTGWWTDRDLPTPLDERLTATVTVGDQVIELYNSNAEREALAVWAFGRFEALGVAAPRVEEIVFAPSRECGDHSGLAHLRSNGATIYQCVRNITCDSPSCERFTNVAKLSMLHELAHPWLERNVDTETRAAFLELTPPTRWRSETTDWNQRGVEWAAEILAWGLLDRPEELLRLGFPPCEQRTSAFRVLTGNDPMSPCEPSSTRAPLEPPGTP